MDHQLKVSSWWWKAPCQNHLLLSIQCAKYHVCGFQLGPCNVLCYCSSWSLFAYLCSSLSLLEYLCKLYWNMQLELRKWDDDDVPLVRRIHDSGCVQVWVSESRKILCSLVLSLCMLWLGTHTISCTVVSSLIHKGIALMCTLRMPAELTLSIWNHLEDGFSRKTWMWRLSEKTTRATLVEGK